MRRRIATTLAATALALAGLGAPSPPAGPLPAPLGALAKAQGGGDQVARRRRSGRQRGRQRQSLRRSAQRHRRAGGDRRSRGYLLMGSLAARNIGASVGIVVITLIGLIFLLSPASIESIAKGDRQHRLLRWGRWPTRAPARWSVPTGSSSAAAGGSSGSRTGASRCPAASSCARSATGSPPWRPIAALGRLPLLGRGAGSAAGLAAPAWWRRSPPPGRSRAGRSTAAARTGRWPASPPGGCARARSPRLRRCPPQGAELRSARAAGDRPRPQRHRVTRAGAWWARLGCCCATRSRSSWRGCRAGPAPSASGAIAAARRWRLRGAGGSAASRGQDARGPRRARRWSSSEAAALLLLGQPRPAHPDRRLGRLSSSRATATRASRSARKIEVGERLEALAYTIEADFQILRVARAFDADAYVRRALSTLDPRHGHRRALRATTSPSTAPSSSAATRCARRSTWRCASTPPAGRPLAGCSRAPPTLWRALAARLGYRGAPRGLGDGQIAALRRAEEARLRARPRLPRVPAGRPTPAGDPDPPRLHPRARRARRPTRASRRRRSASSTPTARSASSPTATTSCACTRAGSTVGRRSLIDRLRARPRPPGAAGARRDARGGDRPRPRGGADVHAAGARLRRRCDPLGRVPRQPRGAPPGRRSAKSTPTRSPARRKPATHGPSVEGAERPHLARELEARARRRRSPAALALGAAALGRRARARASWRNGSSACASPTGACSCTAPRGEQHRLFLASLPAAALPAARVQGAPAARPARGDGPARDLPRRLARSAPTSATP